jgi:hypothetical protein
MGIVPVLVRWKWNNLPAKVRKNSAYMKVSYQNAARFHCAIFSITMNNKRGQSRCLLDNIAGKKTILPCLYSDSP